MVHVRSLLLLTAVALGGFAGCGGDDDPAPASDPAALEPPDSSSVSTTAATPSTAAVVVPPTTVLAVTAPPSTAAVATTAAPAPTGAPADFADAVVGRLSAEWGDAALARGVVESVGVETVAALEQRLAGADPTTAELLAYRPPTVADDQVDSLIVFAFGYREQPDGARDPGTVNEELASVTAAFVADHPVPVFAQEEIAEILTAQGVRDVVSIGPDVDADGNIVYLSTVGVTDKVKVFAADAGIELGQVGVLGFADHAMRCVLTVRAGGLSAAVPAGVTLPTTYDPASGQPWTRDRASYLETDLVARIFTL